MLRSLLHFFLIGGLLFSAKALWVGRETEGPKIRVLVAANASEAEIEQSVREEILLNEAKRNGWDERDPVVFTHLVRNMRFIEPDSVEDDRVLFERALQMNMQAHDPIVRARLLYRAREALSYVPNDQVPSRDALQAHLEANPDRFEREGRLRFEHVFLSRSKRGSALPADAAIMRDQLSVLGDAAPNGLGDPLPGLRSEQTAAVTELRDDYGAELASLVEEAVIGSWRGPVSSVYGLHFVRVLEQQPPYVPAFDAIAAEVRADRLAEIRRALSKERMTALRDAYTVRIERLP